MLRRTSVKELKRQTALLDKLALEERKLLAAHYADAVSLDLLISEQKRIASDRAQAQQTLAMTQLQFADVEAEVDDILSNFGNGYAMYRGLGLRDRRTLNRAAFERLWTTESGIVAANMAAGYAHLVRTDLVERLSLETKAIQAGRITELLVPTTDAGEGRGHE